MPPTSNSRAHALPFIGVRIHKNRTPTGRRTSTPAKRAATYFAYGRDKQAALDGNQRGDWLGPDGRLQSHDKVMDWAKQEALNHRYTFEAILSVPLGQLTPEQFRLAMQAGRAIADWRLMAHQDTQHSHAHILFFQNKRLDKETFLSWQTDVRAELVRQEQQAPSALLRTSLRDRTAHQAQEMAIDMEPATTLSAGKRHGMSLGW
ncbi:MAG: hypothetical protein DHS20C20_30250 [Ardenticatenaceae bacterium]|nr:MAG: hypothetical protein DHS20C20_30250 [Ardenticatenaceae bacterium]